MQLKKLHNIVLKQRYEISALWTGRHSAKEIGVAIYFANPYHSWERGTNENTNGLIRQYIPPKSDFNDYSVDNIIEIKGAA